MLKCLKILVSDAEFEKIMDGGTKAIPPWVKCSVFLESREFSLLMLVSKSDIIGKRSRIYDIERDPKTGQPVFMAWMPGTSTTFRVQKTTAGLSIHGDYWHLVYLAKSLTIDRPRMSYDASYYGENPGFLKQTVSEIERSVTEIENKLHDGVRVLTGIRKPADPGKDKHWIGDVVVKTASPE